MNRLLGLILAFMAALTQIASGALPSDARICIQLPSPVEPCCCCDDSDDAAALPSCPCHSGCDRCLTVTPPDGRATLTTGPRTSDERLVHAVPMSFGIALALPMTSARPQRFRARANESPPDIPIVRTVRLVL